MSDDSLIDDTENIKRKKMATITSAVLAALQVMMLLTYRNYLDFGHILFTIAFAVFALGVFFSLRRAKLIPAIACTLVCVLITGFCVAKVKWNEGYLQELTTRNAFMFEDYIKTYPTLEEHLMSDVLGLPDWIGFANDCGQPVLRNRPIQPTCRTPEGIQSTYRIDIRKEMEAFLRRMQKTAQDVKDERFRSNGQYLSCIGERKCAPIPLLPEMAKPEDIVNDGTQYPEIRQAFWDLVEKKGLTYPACSAMKLCEVLMRTGVVSFRGNPAYEKAMSAPASVPAAPADPNVKPRKRQPKAPAQKTP